MINDSWVSTLSHFVNSLTILDLSYSEFKSVAINNLFKAKRKAGRNAVLNDYEIRGLSLRSCKNVTERNLASVTSVLHNLKIIDLSECPKISSLEKFDAKNCKIKYLLLHSNGALFHVKSKQFVEQTKHNIEILDVSGLPDITGAFSRTWLELCAEYYAESLTSLNCSGNTIFAFEPLFALKNLRLLNLSGCRFSEELEESKLEQPAEILLLPKLKMLDLSRSSMNNSCFKIFIDMIANNKNSKLEWISLSSTRITSLKPLIDFEQLKVIFACDTKLEDNEEELMSFVHNCWEDLLVLDNAEADAVVGLFLMQRAAFRLPINTLNDKDHVQDMFTFKNIYTNNIHFY